MHESVGLPRLDVGFTTSQLTNVWRTLRLTAIGVKYGTFTIDPEWPVGRNDSEGLRAHTDGREIVLLIETDVEEG